MTISSTISSKQFACNGVATQFSFPNKIFLSTDPVVTLIDTNGITYPFTNFANSSTGLNYSVQNVDVDTGCIVVMSAPPTNGWTLDVRTVTSQAQSTSIKNQGSFLPELHEEVFDRLTREIQDVLRLTYTYGIHGPDIETTPWPALPIASARKSMALMFDAATGLPTIGFLSAQNVTQGLLGPLLYPRTAAEISAGVLPINFVFPNGPSRYGAAGDGVTNDQAALAKMGSVSGYHFALDGTYLVSSKVQTSAFLTFEGSTRQNTLIKPASGFADYVLEIGSVAGGPNPNVGELHRLRFANGFSGNAGLLHMNQLSHMWRLVDLLFQSSACPALIVDNCWDSNYTNIDILSCGYTNQPANVGAAVRIINGCNNLYFRGLRVEQCPSGSIYLGPAQGPIFIDEGKIDQGFITQFAAAITILANTGVANSSLLAIDNFSITGVSLFPAVSMTGFASLILGDVFVTGGSGVTAHISDLRTWGHIDPVTYPSASAAYSGPFIGQLDLGKSFFGYAHPSVAVVTPAVVNSKIFPLRAAAAGSVTANGSVTGNTITVGTNFSAASNNIYNGCYLVHNATGTQAAGQAGARRKIVQSFSSGNLQIQGTWGCTIDADWSIEYCGGHYTPNFKSDNIRIANTMDLFAILQTGATIAGPAYTAAGGAAGGATSFTLTASNFPANTDCTGYYLVDEITGEPYYINYGCDGTTKIAVMYDRTADLQTGHTYSIVAGYAANVKQNGTTYEWSLGGKKKFALVSQCDSYGFDISNLPLWGIGVTGEIIGLPYSASINIDMAAGHQFTFNPNNGTAFTINNPLNANNGDELIITVNNVSGGALGALTFGSAYRAAAWTQPANNFNRSITFRYNGGGWKEISRTTVDVPN